MACRSLPEEKQTWNFHIGMFVSDDFQITRFHLHQICLQTQAFR